jgi:hypothetical protein
MSLSKTLGGFLNRVEDDGGRTLRMRVVVVRMALVVVEDDGGRRLRMALVGR